MTLDIPKAITYAQLVREAYEVEPDDLTNSSGKVIRTDYNVITTIYANDLATDILPSRGLNRVSIGFILQSTITGEVVIAIRGTEGIDDWIVDAEFLSVPCPILPGAGQTEDGFTSMYQSFSTDPNSASPSVLAAMKSSAFPQPVTSVTICGHSLGGALATLLGLDIAANTPFKTPAVYTYASPRTGDSQFKDTYNQVVPNTFRIANRADVVPKLPPPPGYEHVSVLIDLNPVRLLPLPPKVLVKLTLPCLHSLDSYIFLLSLLAGGTPIPIKPECAGF